MVSHGEYIVKAASVGQRGMLPLLQAINAGKITPEQIAGRGHAALGGLAELESSFSGRAAGGEADAGGGFGGDTNYSSESHLHYHAGPVSALDGAGVDSILKNNRKAVTQLFHDAVRRGTISPRDLLRHR
jgi:hypothetical protein